MSRNTILGLVGLAFIIGQVAAHGHLSTPVNRGYSYRQDENNAPVAYPLANDFVCRNSPAMPSSMWTTLTAGQSTPISWALEAPHPGDCFAYLSYDVNKTDSAKKWFKVAQWNDCNMLNLATLSFTVPSYLPSTEHAILRWEWYALHLRDINIVEFYSQCADVKIVGSSSGQLPTPQVTIPGHIPMDAKFYRSEYKNPDVVLFTGPPIASVGGAAYSCASTYDSSCTVEPATNNPCTISHQRCTSATTYQACGIGATTTEWMANQSCQTGLVCYPHSDGAHIMCSYPTDNYVAPTPPSNSGVPATQAPVTQAPATQAPATQAPATQTPAPASTPNPSAGSATCVVGNMRCTSSNQYEICSPGSTANYWAGPQSCQSGLYCNQDGSVVRCGYTQNTAVTTARTAAAPASTTGRAASTTGQTASTPSSSTCVLGYQQCTGTSTYKTCGNGKNGPAWGANQSCQVGLSCHASPTANNIYCY